MATAVGALTVSVGGEDESALVVSCVFASVLDSFEARASALLDLRLRLSLQDVKHGARRVQDTDILWELLATRQHGVPAFVRV